MSKDIAPLKHLIKSYKSDWRIELTLNGRKIMEADQNKTVIGDADLDRFHVVQMLYLALDSLHGDPSGFTYNPPSR
jgi:hypothetical protein